MGYAARGKDVTHLTQSMATRLQKKVTDVRGGDHHDKTCDQVPDVALDACLTIPSAAPFVERA